MQKVAIIGAGGMARVHGAAYANMLNTLPVAVVDVNSDAAEALATSLDVQSFTDFHDMLDAVNPDVIDICTPTPSHREYVIRSAAAGKHVVMEKPMGGTLADCREMIRATREAGVTFMVAQVLRFFPEFAAARTQAQEGAVGAPAVVRTTRGGGFPGGWFGDFELSGGVVLDTLVHDFDWLLWTFGEAERVYAKGLAPRMEKLNLDYALVTIRFKSGMIAHVEGNWAHSVAGFNTKMEISGDKGLIDFNARDATPLYIALADWEKGREAIPESPTMQNPYFLELQYFIDCVELGLEPSITPEESMRAVEISLAALQSIRTGRPVDLPLEV